MPNDRYLHSDLTEKIIAAAYKVHRILGSGFLEKVYENALVLELQELGLKVRQQYPINVYYDGNIVGEYLADLWIEDKVIVELKAVQEISAPHEHQLVNYLKATGVEVGLVLGFGEKLAIKRKANAVK